MPGAITAIVPTFNRAAFLREALAALLAQTRPVAQIIVWDDGSTDCTAEAAREVASSPCARGTLRYFRGENGGKSRALNRAMEHVAGDYVWICDDDDLARPDAAERLGAALEASGAGLACGGYVRFWIDPATGARRVEGPGYWPDLSEGSVARHALEDIFLFQNATLVRREAYRLVGPFREDLARSIDYEMLARLVLSFPVAMVKDAVFEQRKHDGARGPLAVRHAAAESEAVWRENDRRAFADLLPLLRPDFFAAMFEALDPLLATRAGRLQRACVLARRGLWREAVEDLRLAAAMDPAGPLTPLERRICRRAMSGKHGCDAAFEPALRRSLAGLGEAGGVGGQIAVAIARGALWRGRKAALGGEIMSATRVAGFAAALARSGFANRRRGLGPPGPLRERSALPAEAYALAGPAARLAAATAPAA